MAFRLGGEEFGILSVWMNDSEALHFAKSIKEKIENEKVQHIKNGASKYLTVSIGLIVIKPNALNNASDIYRYADQALYRAKENGRNQVVAHNTDKL